MLLNIGKFLDNLQIPPKCVPLHCVFHSIRFKVNKGWSKALLLFFLPIPHLKYAESYSNTKTTDCFTGAQSKINRACDVAFLTHI